MNHDPSHLPTKTPLPERVKEEKRSSKGVCKKPIELMICKLHTILMEQQSRLESCKNGHGFVVVGDADIIDLQVYNNKVESKFGAASDSCSCTIWGCAFALCIYH